MPYSATVDGGVSSIHGIVEQVPWTPRRLLSWLTLFNGLVDQILRQARLRKAVNASAEPQLWIPPYPTRISRRTRPSARPGSATHP